MVMIFGFTYLLFSYFDEWQVLQKQISETHFKLTSAASAEEEVSRLKDEMDSLRELAAKASHYEKQMKLCQKKLEEMTDLKQTARLLEEKNMELMKVGFEKFTSLWFFWNFSHFHFRATLPY